MSLGLIMPQEPTFMIALPLYGMAKIADLRMCRNCGVVFARTTGMRVVSQCPNCNSGIEPDTIE